MSNLPTLINVPASISLDDVREGLASVGLAITGHHTMRRVVRMPQLILKNPSPRAEFLPSELPKIKAPKKKAAKKKQKSRN